MHTSSQSGFRPREALVGLRELLRDPDDTKQVFKVLDALRGNTDRRIRDRMRKTEAGARLLRERPALLEVLSDRARLEAMPEGSLGRAYLAFLEDEKITAEGLVHASAEGRTGSDRGEESFVRDHLRDQHDLWHVVAGYRGDVLGEAGMLAFSLAQTAHPGIGLIVAVALIKAGNEGRAFLWEAYKRGRDAAWLPAVDWSALLERPLCDVRAELRMGTPPEYEPVRSSDIEPGTLLSFRGPVTKQPS
jgi:ubiquinone biosynthesis protein COQ4